jgi:hypothetical protein
LQYPEGDEESFPPEGLAIDGSLNIFRACLLIERGSGSRFVSGIGIHVDGWRRYGCMMRDGGVEWYELIEEVEVFEE